MLTGYLNRIKFFVERLLLGGAPFHFLFIAGALVLVSFLAGLIVFLFTGAFPNLLDASWWAFLRLSDPGYLGDDQGALLRSVSTVVTILGYVLFMGAMIAIMTQWLNATIRKFESGLTPITLRGHILILGWTNRTKTVVREIVASQGRVKRFLARIGAGKLRIVILSETVSPLMTHELQEELGGFWRQRQIILRSGTPLRIEDLRRANFTQAGVMLLPGSDFGGSAVNDTGTVKALLSVSQYGSGNPDVRLPLVVAELFDVQKLPVAKSAYRGAIELVPSDAIISRLLAQNVRHCGLSFIYTELLSHSHGNQIYIRELPELKGVRIDSLHTRFPDAIVMGIVRTTATGLKPILNPPRGFSVEKGDRLVFLSRSYDDTLPGPPLNASSGEAPKAAADAAVKTERRLLILGWNRKLPVLLKEFSSYLEESFSIDIFSLLPIADRQELIGRHGGDIEPLHIEHIYGDYTAVTDLRSIDPDRYDNILFLSSDRLESGEEADARTILGYILLRDLLSGNADPPEIIIELMDPGNHKLFEERPGEVLISPVILSHILAHVAMRPELNTVFEELFTSGGAELSFRPAEMYGLQPGETTFTDIQNRATAAGEIALGIRNRDPAQNNRGGILLNPDRSWRLRMDPGDEIVVLTTYT